MVKILIVSVIMVVINVFMVYAVTKAAGSLEATVRRYYIAKLGKEDLLNTGKPENRDVLIISEGGTAGMEEEPEAEKVRIVEVEKEAAPAAASQLPSGGMIAGDTRYKNSQFREDFLTVQRMEALDRETALQNVMEIQDSSSLVLGGVIRSIRELLDYDAAFRLSSRGAEEQEELLRSVLNEEQCRVLDSYLALAPSSFSAIDFYGYLEEKAGQYDENFYVHRPEGVREAVSGQKNVKNVRDDSVTAGMKIIYQNKLYDYSI